MISTSRPYNKVISIYEDSRKRLWFTALQVGRLIRYNPETDNFTRYDMSKGFPSDTIYKMVGGQAGKLMDYFQLWSGLLQSRHGEQACLYHGKRSAEQPV